MSNFIVVKEYDAKGKLAFQHAINKNIIIQVISRPAEVVTEETPANSVIQIMMGEVQNLFVLDSFEDILAQLIDSKPAKKK